MGWLNCCCWSVCPASIRNRFDLPDPADPERAERRIGRSGEGDVHYQPGGAVPQEVLRTLGPPPPSYTQSMLAYASPSPPARHTAPCVCVSAPHAAASSSSSSSSPRSSDPDLPSSSPADASPPGPPSCRVDVPCAGCQRRPLSQQPQTPSVTPGTVAVDGDACSFVMENEATSRSAIYTGATSDDTMGEAVREAILTGRASPPPSYESHGFSGGQGPSSSSPPEGQVPPVPGSPPPLYCSHRSLPSLSRSCSLVLTVCQAASRLPGPPDTEVTRGQPATPIRVFSRRLALSISRVERWLGGTGSSFEGSAPQAGGNRAPEVTEVGALRSDVGLPLPSDSGVPQYSVEDVPVVGNGGVAMDTLMNGGVVSTVPSAATARISRPPARPICHVVTQVNLTPSPAQRGDRGLVRVDASDDLPSLIAPDPGLDGAGLGDEEEAWRGQGAGPGEGPRAEWRAGPGGEDDEDFDDVVWRRQSSDGPPRPKRARGPRSPRLDAVDAARPPRLDSDVRCSPRPQLSDVRCPQLSDVRLSPRTQLRRQRSRRHLRLNLAGLGL